MNQFKHYEIRTQPKSFQHLHIGLVLTSIAICLIVVLLFGPEMTVRDKIILIAAPFLSVLYLSMFVLRLAVTENNITFILPHKKTEMLAGNITSVKVKPGRSGEYIEIKTNRRIGFRSRFNFLIQKNEAEVADLLNHFVKTGVPVYINPNRESGVRLNPTTKQFECTNPA